MIGSIYQSIGTWLTSMGSLTRPENFLNFRIPCTDENMKISQMQWWKLLEVIKLFLCKGQVLSNKGILNIVSMLKDQRRETHTTIVRIPKKTLFTFLTTIKNKIRSSISIEIIHLKEINRASSFRCGNYSEWYNIPGQRQV